MADDSRGSQSSLVYSAAGLIGVQLLSFASMWVVSRSLGPDAYGRLGLALIAGVYAYQVVQAGLDAFQTRLLAQADAAEARKILGGTFRQKQYAALLVLIAGGIIALLWNRPEERSLIFLGIIDGAILALTMPGAFDARGRTATYFAYAAVRQAFYLVNVVLLANAVPGGFTLQNVMLLHLAAIIPQLYLERMWIRKHFGAPDYSEGSLRSMEQVRAAVPLSIGSAAWQCSMVIGPPILEFTGHSKEMGYLVLSNQFAMAAHSVSLLSARTAMARLAKIPDAFGSAFRKEWIYQTVFFIVASTAVALVGSMAGLLIIDRVWGAAFDPTLDLFRVDIWRIVGAFAGGVTSAALTCQSRLKTLAACHVLSFVGAVVLGFALVPKYGALGAVWAVVSARTLFFILSSICLLIPASAPREVSA